MPRVGNLVSEKLLPLASHPAQYIGLELNRRCPDVEQADVAVVLAFSDSYDLGISHLGSQVLYHMLNSMDSVACDRAYCPRPDAEAVMRAEGIPLFGWESRCAVADFDILGFSLPYELCVTNVLTMLDLAGIPIHAADRRESDPIVIAGDALADTPEPMAAFIDLFLIGDGEEPLSALVKLVREMKLSGASRAEMILQAARTIPAAYAPQFYEARGLEGAPFTVPQPLRKDVPATIRRAHVANLSDWPAIAAPLVPIAEGVQERVVIEIMRGCPNGCRFCQAGHTRLPVRCRGVDEIVDVARRAVAATGFDEISLLSLSASDYPRLDELIDRLNAEFAHKRVSISLPSLRVDSRLEALPRLISTVRKGGLTIAAEAGSERLRRAIRKDISEDHMLAGVRAAYEAGWRKVKVYFMAGLPGETDADVDAIFDLCRRLSQTGKEVFGRPGAISASVSWFVPKPHTPMQWCAMRDAGYLLAVRQHLRDLSRRSAVSFKFHWVERSLLEAVIARGDRRVGAAIEAAWRAGARMDSWNEYFDYGKWTAAFEQTGIDPASIANAELPLDAPLPWSHITGHRDADFLRRQHSEMLNALSANP